MCILRVASAGEYQICKAGLICPEIVMDRMQTERFSIP